MTQFRSERWGIWLWEEWARNPSAFQSIGILKAQLSDTNVVWRIGLEGRHLFYVSDTLLHIDCSISSHTKRILVIVQSELGAPPPSVQYWVTDPGQVIDCRNILVACLRGCTDCDFKYSAAFPGRSCNSPTKKIEFVVVSGSSGCSRTTFYFTGILQA